MLLMQVSVYEQEQGKTKELCYGLVAKSAQPLENHAWLGIFEQNPHFEYAGYNPLLISDLFCSVEARDLARDFEFENCFIPMFQIAINGGLATAEWQNVIEHQVSVARLSRAYARLVGLSCAEEARVTAAALVHDADMRREKEELNRIKISRTILGGTDGDAAYQEAFFSG